MKQHQESQFSRQREGGTDSYTPKELRKEAEYRAKERKISFAMVKRNLSRRNQKLQDVISVPCTALIPTG